jgi:hypothetical protein
LSKKLYTKFNVKKKEDLDGTKPRSAHGLTGFFYERADQRNLPDEVGREGGRVHRAAKAWDDVTSVLQPEINILDYETKLLILIQPIC